MKYIKLKSSDLEELQKLGKGACATVYKFGEDLVVKVFNEKGIKLHDNDDFSKLIGVKNGTCIFPNYALEIDEKFQGCAMPYIEGVELHKIIKELDFGILIPAILKAEDDLQPLSINNKIIFIDLNQGGIMWSNQNEIKIIDTDSFTISEDISQEKCYSHNLNTFNTIVESILGIENGQQNNILDFLSSKDEYSQLNREYIISSIKGNNMSVIKLLEKAIELFENEFKRRPTNINEMEAMLKGRKIPKDADNSSMENRKQDDDGR